jgi:hypothetical protein
MMPRHRVKSWLESGQQDGLARPEITPALLLVSGMYVAWWVLGLVFGPVWLALTRRDHAMVDDAWSTGDGQ